MTTTMMGRGVVTAAVPSRASAMASRIQLPQTTSDTANVLFRRRGVSTSRAARAAEAAGEESAAASASGKQNSTTATPPPPPMVVVDGMPRYPEASVPGMLRAADYFGTAIFAMTGTLAAAARGMDAFGATVVGTITAVGGGTIRDILLGKGRRAFWMEEIEYLWICVVTGATTFFAWPHLERILGVNESDEWIDWGDAVGVGAFCVIGAMNGIRAGVPCAAAVACGMFTATFGGVVRDVLMNRPVRILHSYTDIYATTALTGATTYMLVRAAGAPVSARILLGMGAAVAMRKIAWTYDLRLPTYDAAGVGGDDGAAAKAAAAAKGDAGEGLRPPVGEIVAAAIEAMGFGKDEEEKKKKEEEEKKKKKGWKTGFFRLGGGGGNDTTV